MILPAVRLEYPAVHLWKESYLLSTSMQLFTDLHLRQKRKAPLAAYQQLAVILDRDFKWITSLFETGLIIDTEHPSLLARDLRLYLQGSASSVGKRVFTWWLTMLCMNEKVEPRWLLVYSDKSQGIRFSSLWKIVHTKKARTDRQPTDSRVV